MDDGNKCKIRFRVKLGLGLKLGLGVKFGLASGFRRTSRARTGTVPVPGRAWSFRNGHDRKYFWNGTGRNGNLKKIIHEGNCRVRGRARYGHVLEERHERERVRPKSERARERPGTRHGVFSKNEHDWAPGTTGYGDVLRKPG